MKKIVLLMLCALPLGLFAQEKLAHVNVQEIFQVMPDLSNIEKTIADMNETYKKELDVMYQEYQAKAKEYQDNLATMAETIKAKRQGEIVDLEKRIGTFQQQAQEDLQKKQLEMVNALREKIVKAAGEVATENKYAYVFDVSSQTLIYTAPTTIDITPLVKKKLGIK